MDLSTITVTDFKNLFARDFPYLPNWDAARIYNAGNKVYYATTLLFYTAKVNGITAGTLPTDTSKWDVTADDVFNYVLDEDINKAFLEAQAVLNQSLYSSDAVIKMAYLYLTAHFLVNDIKTGNLGVQSTGNYTVSSRSVGSVSESYAIPSAYTEDPILNFYTKSGYGLKYLNMTLPNIVGNVVAVCGATLA